MEHLQSIKQFFEKQIFSIPDYQRGYAWEERHWQDLWDDIDLLEKEQVHYTGTLVIHKASEEIFDDEFGNQFVKYNIVDGQQRLTTLSIMMIEMIRQFEKLGDISADEMRTHYIAIKKHGALFPKLQMSKDTKDFYLKRIVLDEKNSITQPKTFSEKRLAAAQEFFESQFEEKRKELGDDFLHWLKEIKEKIVSKMQMTVYEVASEADVGIIFEVMNNRGKPLTETEKVKNYLLFLCMKISEHGGEQLALEVNDTWKYVYEMLMENDVFGAEDSLLRFNWIITQDYNAKKWQGCNSIKVKFNLKDSVGKYAILREDIRQYIENLRKSCKAYCDIFRPENDKAFSHISDAKIKKDIIEYQTKLIHLNIVAPFVPLFISLRLMNSEPEEYLEILKLCEIYAFKVFAVMGKRTNTGQSGLYKMAYNYLRNEISFDEVVNLIKQYLTIYCSKEEYEQKVDNYGDWYNWRGIKYLLFEYEIYLAQGVNIHLDWEKLQKKDKKDSIEHILPQTESKSAKGWRAKERAKYLHDFGNLVITLDNPSYSNKTFGKKRGFPGAMQKGEKLACYANSALYSERELYEKFETWMPEDCERRHKMIGDWMKKRWFSEDCEINREIDESEDDFEEEI